MAHPEAPHSEMGQTTRNWQQQLADRSQELADAAQAALDWERNATVERIPRLIQTLSNALQNTDLANLLQVSRIDGSEGIVLFSTQVHADSGPQDTDILLAHPGTTAAMGDRSTMYVKDEFKDFAEQNPVVVVVRQYAYDSLGRNPRTIRAELLYGIDHISNSFWLLHQKDTMKGLSTPKTLEQFLSHNSLADLSPEMIDTAIADYVTALLRGRDAAAGGLGEMFDDITDDEFI